MSARTNIKLDRKSGQKWQKSGNVTNFLEPRQVRKLRQV